MPAPVTSPERRTILKGSAALMAVGATGTLSALYARQAEAQATSAPQQLAAIPGPYGALRPVNDLITGLPLLLLPEGFSYTSDNNTEWMTDAELQAWIETNRAKIGSI